MIGRARVVIADDHTLAAELCKSLLEAEFSIVGVVSDGCAMVRAAYANYTTPIYSSLQ